MAITNQRYIVVELTGYRGLADREKTTTVMILDRDYCHEVVAAFRPVPGHGSRGQHGLEQRRLHAQALVRKWNQDHHAWRLAPHVAAGAYKRNGSAAA